VDEKTGRLAEALEKHCRFLTTPVAVKLARQGESLPGKVKYPLNDLGNRLSVCQGMSIARTFGWTMAFRDEDHACPIPRVFMGHIKPDTFLEGSLGEYYQDQESYMKEMEASYPRWPLNSFAEIWLAPVNRCAFEPDAVVAYGNPAQIGRMVQAAIYVTGAPVQSQSIGGVACSEQIARTILTGEPQIVVAGGGERILALTQDHEASFALPAQMVEAFAAALAETHKQGVRYPTRSWLTFGATMPPNFGQMMDYLNE